MAAPYADCNTGMPKRVFTLDARFTCAEFANAEPRDNSRRHKLTWKKVGC